MKTKKSGKMVSQRNFAQRINSLQRRSCLVKTKKSGKMVSQRNFAQRINSLQMCP